MIKLDFIRRADQIFSVLTYKQLILFTILTQWQNSKKINFIFQYLKIIFKNNTIDKDEELKETIQKIEENIKKGIQKRCNDNPDNETIKKQTDYYNKLMDFN